MRYHCAQLIQTYGFESLSISFCEILQIFFIFLHLSYLFLQLADSCFSLVDLRIVDPPLWFSPFEIIQQMNLFLGHFNQGKPLQHENHIIQPFLNCQEVNCFVGILQLDFLSHNLGQDLYFFPVVRKNIQQLNCDGLDTQISKLISLTTNAFVRHSAQFHFDTLIYYNGGVDMQDLYQQLVKNSSQFVPQFFHKSQSNLINQFIIRLLCWICILSNQHLIKQIIMKEKCWKELKKQLCPRDKWQPDSAHNKCLCCCKEFKILVRRRHHCRFCGNIFCSDCSDYFINGTYLEQKKQKYVRHCEFCHKKIQKFIKDWTKPEVYDQKGKQDPQINHEIDQQDILNENSQMGLQMEEFESEDGSLDEQFIDDSDRYQLQKLFSAESIEKTQQANSSLDQNMNMIINDCANTLCEKWNIDKKHWKAKLAQLAIKGAIETKMDPLANQGACENAMDIARKIKIKTILTEESKAIQILMKGIVLEKSPPTKHSHLHLSKPNIIVIEKSIDLDSLTSFIKFEELIKNDKAIIKKIMEKIVRLNPDIIFVEQNVHVFALQYLQSKEIVVISKLKPKQLELIKQVSGIKKSVKKLWMLERYKTSQIVGKCDKIYFKGIRQNQYMMFMEADVGIRTILLGEETEEQINALKRAIQILLRIARQLNLQKHFILADTEVRNNLSSAKKQLLSKINSFSSVVYKNLESYLMFQEHQFTKISYKPIKMSQTPKLFQEYGQRQGKTSYKEICGKPEYLSKKIYTSADMTLGGYFLLTAVNYDYERFCKKCNGHHQERYYVDGHSISIKVQRKILESRKNTEQLKTNEQVRKSLQRKQLEEKMLKIQSEKTQRQNQFGDDSKPYKSSYSFVDDFYQKTEEITLEKLKSHLNKQKQIIIIESSAQCQICGDIISKMPIKLGKFYLSNSFYHIMYLLVQASIQYELGENIRNLTSSMLISKRMQASRKLSLDKCNHPSVIRVYQYSGTIIKVLVEKTLTSSVNFIDLKESEAISHIQQKQKKFIQKISSSELSQKRQMLDILWQKITSTLLTLQSSTRSVSISPNYIDKLKLLLEHLNKMREIIDKCQIQLKKQVEIKYQKELEEKKNSDWTVFLRKMSKIESIIRMSFVIIESVENQLKRKKIQESSPSSKDNEPVLEQEDIKGFIDDEDTNQEDQPNPLKQSISTNTLSYTDLKGGFSQADTQIRQYLKTHSKYRYPRIQGSYLHFQAACLNQPVTLLACGINSHEYRKAYEESLQPLTSDFAQNLAQNRQSGKQYKAQVSFRLTLQKVLKTQWPPRLQLNKIYSELVGQMIQKLQIVDFTVYYPKQFEQLRQQENIDNQMYIRGLCTCKNWNSSGGKSNSLFAKSENDLLVVKVINEKQFDEFLKFTKDYLEYMHQSKVAGKNTLLAKVYGIYGVTVKGKTYKCIVMQNIFFGINSTNIISTYDLKGSEVNRLNLPENETKYTGQDTNFRIDKEGEPYILKPQQYDKIIKILEEDANFLKEHAVIDYSLLVIETREYLRLGIIDYMRPYHLMEKLETFYKEFKSGRDPTVIPPSSYAQRFLSAMKNYFIKAQ